MDTSTLTRDQLDRTLASARSAAIPPRPPGGWLRTIREALGMTTRQAAARAGISLTALQAAERNEAGDSITLRQLKRLAAALDCEVRYVVVPRHLLAETLDRRAEALARAQVEPIAHSMTLEAQATDRAFVERQIDEIKDDLLRGRRSRLWVTKSKP